MIFVKNQILKGWFDRAQLRWKLVVASQKSTALYCAQRNITEVNEMIYRARKGTKVKVAAKIVWPTEWDQWYFADRVAKLGGNTWKVYMACGDRVMIKVADDFQIIPKYVLDRAA